MHPPLPPNLRSAITNLYGIFRRYGLPPHVPGCDHCVSPSDNDDLHAHPLEKLTAQNLSRFAHKSMTTWGSVQDFKHFLPRLFELLVTCRSYDYVDPEILLGKLAYGHWLNWPAPEQSAVRNFLTAQWQTVLNTSPDEDSSLAGTWLCAIANAEDDLAPYLQLWLAHRSPTALHHLALLFTDCTSDFLTHGQLPNAFWDDSHRQMLQVTTWLASSTIHTLLENAVLTTSSDPSLHSLSQTLSDALTLQESLANSPLIASSPSPPPAPTSK